jgi:predicted O-methyltransferase YrrM
MPTQIPETMLPNGMKVFYHNKDELKFLYEKMPLYLKHGISLREDATIFEVGTNIGLFTLLACQLCHNKINIYAFEPIQETFQILQRKAQRLQRL